MSDPIEPCASTVDQHRSRMQTLATPPALAASETNKELCLPEHPESSTSSSPRRHRHRDESLTPSPPASESSCPDADAGASGSQTPSTEASESSADSSSYLRRSRGSEAAAALKKSLGRPRHDRIRPSLASKRVLSEGDVILPRASKRCRVAVDVSPRGSSFPLSSNADAIAAAFSSASAVATSNRVPSITSWRLARNQKRDRQRAKRGKKQAARADADAVSPSTATPSSSASIEALPAQAGATKTDVLPELRLLSATRTAPIGWSRFAGASSFVPHRVEVYDERDAKLAPERQRFWPIIDHQLDYTGARMLSLSNPSYSLQKTHGTLALDAPVSPKSGLLSIQPPVVVESLSMGSSDEEHSPLTPGAPPRHSAARVSRHARDAVRNEAHRKPTIPLSPAATLAAVIDFTRAQAASQPARNAYGQLVYSPPSPPAVKPQHDLAAHAPLRIAPRRQQDGSASKGRDYFGHWETYLCNFGKESTF